MTNRFHKLELEDVQPQDLPPKLGPASAQQQQPSQHAAGTWQEFQGQEELRDENYWMRTADQSRRRGNYEDALRYYSRSVELNRALVAGWVGQVQMLILLGEYPEAELWARKALELFRANAELFAARAQALCRRGDLKSAQAVCDAAMAQPGMTAYPWVVRGEVMLARKENAEQHCFDKAVQLDNDWLVLIEIALVYRLYKRHAKALARCRQATERAVDQPFCWYQQGRSETDMGLHKHARRSFKQCLDLDPKNAAARAALDELDGGVGSIRRAWRRWMGQD